MSAKGLLRRFGGFSLVGLGNTLLSMGLICVMVDLLGVDCRASYVTAYVVTVVLAYWLNARLVFRAPLSARGLVGFFMVYLAGLVLGVALLQGLTALFPGRNPVLLSCLVLIATTAFNFAFVNWLLRTDLKDWRAVCNLSVAVRMEGPRPKANQRVAMRGKGTVRLLGPVTFGWEQSPGRKPGAIAPAVGAR